MLLKGVLTVSKGMRLGSALAMVLMGILIIGGQFVNQPALNTDIELPMAGLFEGERHDGGYFTIVDSAGQVVSKTSRMVYPSDEIITEDNKLYRVERVDGDTAYAKFVRDVEMPTISVDETTPVNSALPAQGEQKSRRLKT